MNLNQFLVAAKRNTYARSGEGGEKKLPDGGRELVYEDKGEGFKYRDRYFGFNPFCGEEMVWQDGETIWGMNYYGGVTAEDAGPEGVYRFLKAALRRVTEARPFRGPLSFKEGVWEYQNSVRGDYDRFTGNEKILHNGKEVYRLDYHGGLVG